ncbi:hypothetical protein SUGI_0919060 [Cryptomeria japonica]|uniref:pathogen-associated molecular patterns-induced protein A70 n=1 Tax=Cryptomeria japonica TaxID=3369 RepID=UPI0024149F28|nr:pathogen-associated molecular patterns-induced protein A70 [Cryptomeria japonica]GLJ44066.1 hypothetical protein SUGI_0919060 [Cryptomeria japonica]
MSGTGGGFGGPIQVWDTVQSWFTPTVLFVLLNIVIGTIAVSSRMLGNSNNNENPNGLRRAPSLLARFSSMTFNKMVNDQAEVHTWIEPQEAVVEDNVVVREEEKPVIEQKKRPSRAAQGRGRGGASSGLSQRTGNVKNGLARSKSDAAPLIDLHPPPPPLPGTIRKSETFELNSSQAKAVVAGKPPISTLATDFQEVSGTDGASTDGVDAKADDFINKFKQQLKLQRLESLMRYKDTLNKKM